MLHIAKKRELTEFFRSVPLEKKQQVYRGVRAVVAMLVKISKMTELYPIRDKIFTEFTETLMQNLDVIHNNIPYVSVTTKKIGFYYQERRINLFDAGERKFRNIFLVNEIRELYFVKGITPEELLNFFSVIQETINYTLIDYDFNTRLWDRGVTHIGTLSDPDMGDPEPWGADEFNGEVDPVTPAALCALPPGVFMISPLSSRSSRRSARPAAANSTPGGKSAARPSPSSGISKRRGSSSCATVSRRIARSSARCANTH